jgi:hypothetical protein
MKKDETSNFQPENEPYGELLEKCLFGWVFGLTGFVFLLIWLFPYLPDYLAQREKFTGFWLVTSPLYWIICYASYRILKARKEIRSTEGGESKKPKIVIVICSFIILFILCSGLFLFFKFGRWSEYARKKAAIEASVQIESSKDKERERPRRESEHRQWKAESLVQGLIYVKDLRTGVCYAFYCDRYDDARNMLATVPESAIPPEMLIIADVGKREVKLEVK